jgi:hypothetical protein
VKKLRKVGGKLTRVGEMERRKKKMHLSENNRNLSCIKLE